MTKKQSGGGRGYDPEKDAEVRDLGTHSLGEAEVKIRIMSYNGGEQKMDIKRQRYYNDKVSERALGRLTKEEALALAGLLKDLAGEESFWL